MTTPEPETVQTELLEIPYVPIPFAYNVGLAVGAEGETHVIMHMSFPNVRIQPFFVPEEAAKLAQMLMRFAAVAEQANAERKTANKLVLPTAASQHERTLHARSASRETIRRSLGESTDL